MDPILGPIIGGLISGGSSLLGSSMNAKAQQAIAAANIQNQINFAKNSLSWRAQDATEAQQATGINRLALLGVPTSSFSNVVGATDPGAGVREAGQDIGRAVAAASSIDQRRNELENKLLEAKIANVNADTTQQLARASDAARVNAPGTPPPMPREDPRGPIIPLMQRAQDPRTGEIIWIPSEKAASPLQTLAAMPTNAALAGRGASEGLLGFPGGGVNWGWPDWLPLRRDAWRGVDNSQYVPF